MLSHWHFSLIIILWVTATELCLCVCVCVVPEWQHVSMTNKHWHARTSWWPMQRRLWPSCTDCNCDRPYLHGIRSSEFMQSLGKHARTHRHVQTQRKDPSGLAAFDPQGVTCGDACKPDHNRWRQSTAEAVLLKRPLVFVAAGRYWSGAHWCGNANWAWRSTATPLTAGRVVFFSCREFSYHQPQKGHSKDIAKLCRFNETNGYYNLCSIELCGTIPHTATWGLLQLSHTQWKIHSFVVRYSAASS